MKIICCSFLILVSSLVFAQSSKFARPVTKKIRVQATKNQSDPYATNIKLQKGQSFSIVINEKDKWSGGGSKENVFCDSMGYSESDPWMQLHYQIGDAVASAVGTNRKFQAISDGKLFFYAHDKRSSGNKGSIRIAITYEK